MATPTAFALAIPDIILLILDQLLVFKPHDVVKSLAALACTSRAWHAPALAALWRELPDPAPLRALMPPADEAGRPEAWHAFDKHAVLVRSWGPDTRFLAYYLHQRAAMSQQDLIPNPFPALRSVGLQSDAPPSHKFKLLALRSAYVYFSYWSLPPSATPWELMHFLASAPHLTSLSLAGRVPLSALTQLADLEALHTLDLARAELPDDEAALLLLAGLDVRALVLPRIGWYDPDPSIVHAKGQSFAHLEHLSFPSCSPLQVASFLVHVVPDALQSLSITSGLFPALFPSSNPYSSWADLIENLPQTLRVLRLRTGPGEGVCLGAFAALTSLETLDADVCMSAVSASPQAASHAMKCVRLRLQGAGDVAMEPGDISTAKLACALHALWPSLERVIVMSPKESKADGGLESEGVFGENGGADWKVEEGDFGGKENSRAWAGVEAAVRRLQATRAR
ncbi:hypothetical protein HWV62_9345 [Athelia sp. TMB]|nr:hypothetical protein HWV62_9345 [Athelia sp. TMB]